MIPRKILFTHSAGSTARKLMAGLASGIGEMDYLEDYPDDQRSRAFDEADIVLSMNPAREMTEEELSRLGRGKYLQLLSAGMDHLPFTVLSEDLILAGNAGAYAIPMAEHAVGMILSLAKRLREEDQNMRKGEFNQMRQNLLLHGKKAIILGFGGIGRETARLLRAFGMKIYAVNTSGNTNDPVDFAGTTDDLPAILGDAQVIVISLPLTRYTRNLIGEKELNLMRDDAILVNVARGEIIDQKALYQKLKNFPDFKAGIESWWIEPFRHGHFEVEYPLLELPNVLACPHNSAMVPETSRLGLENAFQNIRRYVEGRPLKGLLDREVFVI